MSLDIILKKIRDKTYGINDKLDKFGNRIIHFAAQEFDSDIIDE